MKKILAMILAVSMLFCFAACGMSADDDDVKGSVKTSSGESVDVEEAFSLGVAEDSEYENKFLGLGFKIADGWSFYDEDEIAELNGISLDNMDEDLADAIEDVDYFYDVFAHSADNKSSINIMFEKHSRATILATDLEDVAENSIKNVIDTYENMGFTDMKSEIKDVDIDGEDYTGFTLTSSYAGAKLYQTCFMAKKGNYVITVSIAAVSESELQDLIDSFYHL